MKITSLSVQTRNKNRVNVTVDGKYRFSLDSTQIADLGIRVGQEYNEDELVVLEEESKFGKLYTRTLEYCFSRPHSRQEVRQYLFKKTLPKRTKTGTLSPGVSLELANRVFNRLDERGYLNDETFARYWVENRYLRKGISVRKLRSELRAKGIDPIMIDAVIEHTERKDADELHKVIAKKAHRYNDSRKLMAYLIRQGFSYADIKDALKDGTVD